MAEEWESWECVHTAGPFAGQLPAVVHLEAGHPRRPLGRRCTLLAPAISHQSEPAPSLVKGS